MRDYTQFFDLLSKLVDKMETRLKDVETKLDTRLKDAETKVFIMWYGGGILLLVICAPILVQFVVKKILP